MLTKEQALTADEFHYGECSVKVGPRGGKVYMQEIWRRNGATQTWKTRPNDWRIPVKHGLYDYGQIYSYENLSNWHTLADCTLDKSEEGYQIDIMERTHSG